MSTTVTNRAPQNNAAETPDVFSTNGESGLLDAAVADLYFSLHTWQERERRYAALLEHPSMRDPFRDTYEEALLQARQHVAQLSHVLRVVEDHERLEHARRWE